MLDRVTELYPDADYVLLFLEDFFLKARVDTQHIVDLARTARSRAVGCLRLAAGLPLALPPTYELPELPGIGVITSGEEYRVTLQVALWRISTLRQLLVPGLNAWQFEEIATNMSESINDPFWGVMKPAIHYDHAIEKGKWKPVGLAILREAGLHTGVLTREVFSDAELTSHFDRSRAESDTNRYRSAALRSFLLGNRKKGLQLILRHFLWGKSILADMTLGLVGLLGSAVTRKALAVYVRLQILVYAQEEQHNL